MITQRDANRARTSLEARVLLVLVLSTFPSLLFPPLLARLPDVLLDTLTDRELDRALADLRQIGIGEPVRAPREENGNPQLGRLATS